MHIGMFISIVHKSPNLLVDSPLREYDRSFASLFEDVQAGHFEVILMSEESSADLDVCWSESCQTFLWP